MKNSMTTLRIVAIAGFLGIILLFMITSNYGCENNKIKFEVKPISISYNLSDGKIQVAFEKGFHTPIGTFSFEGESSVNSLPYDKITTSDASSRPQEISNLRGYRRLLVIVVERKMEVHEIEDNVRYSISIKYGPNSGGDLRVELSHTGDIFVRLQVNPPSPSPAPTASPSPTPSPTPVPTPSPTPNDQRINTAIEESLVKGIPTPYCSNERCKCCIKSEGKVECECSPSSNNCSEFYAPTRNGLFSK